MKTIKNLIHYVQRGGIPSGYDRILGTRFGAEAVAAIADGISGHIVFLNDSNYKNSNKISNFNH